MVGARIGVAAALAALLTGAATPAGRGQASPAGRGAGAERVVAPDGLVPVTVNGRALRLRVEPSAPGLPQIAPALAPDLGLKGGGLLSLGVAYQIGHEVVFGRTQVVRFGWDGGRPEKRRVGWVSRAWRPAAGDGIVGPGGVPEPVVRFALRPARAGETTAVLPMAGGTGLFGGWFVLDGAARVGATPLFVRFDPRHPRTLVNAPAAVALAAAHGGAMTAETGRQEIVFGVERPFRVLRLARPLAIGGVSLASVGVRVTDGEVSGRIAEEGAAPPDPDEVVVTGRRKGRPRPALLILGADALGACSAIVFDKPARQVRLSCGG